MSRLQVYARPQLARDVARQQPALTRASHGIAGHRVHEHADARGEPRVLALSEDARDRSGEHITHASTCHAWIAPLADAGNPARCADQGARAFQHHRAAVALDDVAERGQSVALDVIRAPVDEARRLARMRRENPVVAGEPTIRLGDEIERIRIDDQRLVATQHLIERAMRPRAATETGPDGNDTRALDGFTQHFRLA